MAVKIKVDFNDLGGALDTKFMTQNSKKLIKDAWQGRTAAFTQDMCNYKWSNTRDYTMVLITLTPLALAQKAKNKFSEVNDAFQKLNMADLKRLFSEIGKGDGRQIRIIFNSGAVDTYRNLFHAVLKAGDSKLSKQKLDELWDGYVTQMGKMSRWVINKNYVNETLIPLVDDMFPSAIGDAFSKGLNKNSGGVTKKDVNRIDLSLDPNPEVSKVEPSSEQTKGKKTDTKSEINLESVNQKEAARRMAEEAERKRKAEEEETRRKAAEEEAIKEHKLEEYLYNKDSSGNFMPSPNDINQSGQAENCYMLGVLVALAERDPKFIKDQLIKLKGDQIIVSLYDYKSELNDPGSEEKKQKYKKQEFCTPLGQHDCKVSKDEIDKISRSYFWNAHKAKWVFAVEVAFAKLLREFHADEFKSNSGVIDLSKDIDGSFENILKYGGSPAEATTILTGEKAKRNLMLSYKDRKEKQENFPKKFPENAKYDDYCIKIRDRILKHRERSGSASGLMVASFNRINSNISRGKLYNVFKENPELLIKYRNMLGTGYTPYALDCVQIMENPDFGKSDIFWASAWEISDYFAGHIDDAELQEVKKRFNDNDLPKNGMEWHKYLEDNPKLALETYDIWYPHLKDNEKFGILYEQFKELMEGKILFAKSEYFDRYLKYVIVPYLSKVLGKSEFEQFRKREGLVSDHAYAILDCFEDKETKYWYVTLQNTWGGKSKIDYSKSKRLKTVKLPPEPKPGVENVFNMELADFCKYLKGLSYDKA